MYKGNVKSMFILIVLMLVYGCPAYSERTMDDKLKNGYFAMCYTSQFADRFSLPTSKAMDLSHGMQAIAIEIRPAAKLYHTFIHLYIDSSLEVYSPGDECNYYRKPKAERFFIKHYNDKDYQWNFNFVEKAGMRMLYLSKSPDPSIKGLGQSLEFEIFRKEFLPGLSLISSSRIISDYLDVRAIPAEVLVQKSNVGNYLLGDEPPGNPKHPENYYAFKIPEKLHKTIQPYLEHLDTKLKYIDESRDPLVDFP
jgi:hypothetical protein